MNPSRRILPGIFEAGIYHSDMESTEKHGRVMAAEPESR